MEETVNGADLNFEASDIEQTSDELGTSPAVEDATEHEDSASEETQAVESEAVPAQKEETQTSDATTEFLSKKGIKSDDPQALQKVVDMYRNAEKMANQKSQHAAQLERQLAKSSVPEATPDREALREIRSLKTEMAVTKWKQERNLTTDQEQKMMEWCTQPMTDINGNVKRDFNGNVMTKGWNYLNGNMSLDDIYRLSGADQVEVSDLKAKLRDEVEREMQARQSAKRPSASTTDSTKFGKSAVDDPFLSGFLG